MAALDERNLRRAVHRYGTLPKGARIGAYLESLRVSGMTPEPPSSSSDNTATAPPGVGGGGGHESDSTLDNVSSGAQGTLERDRPPSAQGSGAAARIGRSEQQQLMMRSNSSHGGFNSGGSGGRSK